MPHCAAEITPVEPDPGHAGEGRSHVHSARLDDCHVRLGRGCGDPGRPEGLCRGRRVRHVGHRRLDRAEHDGGHRRPRGADRLHPGAAPRRLRRHRSRRCEDGDALLEVDHRHGRGLPAPAARAARGRPCDDRELRREAAARRRGRHARLASLSARDGRDAEPERGGCAGRLRRHAQRARRAAARARRAGGDRHRRSRRRGRRPSVRRRSARRDPGRAPRRARDARRGLHALRDADGGAREGRSARDSRTRGCASRLGSGAERADRASGAGKARSTS